MKHDSWLNAVSNWFTIERAEADIRGRGYRPQTKAAHR